MLLGYAQFLGNLADAQQLRLLGDFDVGQGHVLSSSPDDLFNRKGAEAQRSRKERFA
jgi:hypothetical protein